MNVYLIHNGASIHRLLFTYLPFILKLLLVKVINSQNMLTTLAEKVLVNLFHHAIPASYKGKWKIKVSRDQLHII